MGKAHNNGNICPWCLQQFDRLIDLKQHLKSTGHKQFIGNDEKKALQTYHQEKVRK